MPDVQIRAGRNKKVQMSLISLAERFFGGNLIVRIGIGIVAGIVLAWLSPAAATASLLLGDLFVSALRAVAPVLVFVLVASALANKSAGEHTSLRPVVSLYLIGTFGAAFVAVIMSTLFPTELILNVTEVSISPPDGIGEVLKTLLDNVVDNPVSAIMKASTSRWPMPCWVW